MKRPNVLLISIDTLRADHVSCYGYHKKTTPNIDRIASEGTIFRQNYSTGVWTPPGHASMLTGLYVSEHGVHGERRLSDDIPTIATVLKEHGYQTAGFVNNSQVGELVGFHKGHDIFVEVWKGIKSRSITVRAIRGIVRRFRRKLGYEDKGASRTNNLFKDWIERHINKKRPFYVFLHYIEPHNPLNPPRPYKNKYLNLDLIARSKATKQPTIIDMKKIMKAAHNPLICYVEELNLNNYEVEVLKALYDGEIAYTDSKIGEIISFLKKNNLYEDTLIIITSDHGEHFGEYGLWSHVASLYKEVLHVPLITKYPKGVEYIKEVNEYTQLVDILSTVTDIAGVSKKVNTSGISLVYGKSNNKYHEQIFAEWEGRVPYFIQDMVKVRAEVQGNEEVDTERFKIQMAMIQDKEYKYILKSDGNEEIYEINDKEVNLKMQNKKEIKDLLYHELLKREKSMRNYEEIRNYSIDDEVAKNLKALGYM